MATGVNPALGPNPEKGTVQATGFREQKPVEGAEKVAFLLAAQTRFRTCADYESNLRAEQELDQRFFEGTGQWPDQLVKERTDDGRPSLTINRLKAFKRQITNQQRQAKPSIQVNPVDSRNDPKVAEIYQGLIRHIEQQSYADVAYDTACEHQVIIGRGYIRLVVEWDEADPWNQVIRIRRIRNPFLVYMDPSCQEHDYSDARYAFIIEDIPKEEFEARYGNVALDNAKPFSAHEDRTSDWMPEGKIRVAEYFYVEMESVATTLLSNGEEIPTEELENEELKEYLAFKGVHVVRSREIETRKVKWARITGGDILEQREWPGKWIPLVPVLGDELDVNGKVNIAGMVRDARDPQRMYNYWVSAETEAIALAPKTPVVGAEGQFEGHESKWKLANRRNFPYLEYKIKAIGQQLVPPPARQSIEPPIQAIAMATRQADNDLKAVIGLYDASLGERGPEESARAILARQRQGDLSNSHWVDNLVRSLRALGRQMIDLIPKIYDSPRVMRILGADDQPMDVMIHAGAAPEDLPSADSEVLEGLEGVYNLGVGRFDVTVSVGPDTPSRRQEAVQAMTAFIQAFPAAAPVIGDVMAENMDWPGASIVAKRLKKLVPPQVLDENQASPEVLQQQLAQAQQIAQLMQQELMEAKRQLEAQTIQAQSRERIAAMQEQGKVAIAMAELQNEEGRAQAQTALEAMRIQTESQREAAALQLEATKSAATITHDTIERRRDREHESDLNERDNRVKLAVVDRQDRTKRAIASAQASTQEKIADKKVAQAKKAKTASSKKSKV